MSTSVAQLVPIVNRALQAIGTRTTVTADELTNGSSNEAIQAMLVADDVRQDMLRMAPWNFATVALNLSVITAAPGSPDNPSGNANRWVRGIPLPPWLYEYASPTDCLKPLWITPQDYPGMNYPGGAVPFKVASDLLYSVSGLTISGAGTGYAVGDTITCTIQTNAFSNDFGTDFVTSFTALNGTPALASVTSIGPGGTVTGVSLTYPGGYFKPQGGGNTTTTSGAGNGLVLTLAYNPQDSQRVVLTNESQACLIYCRDVTNPAEMDSLFTSAWVDVLASMLAMALTGDKSLANMLVQRANKSVEAARAADGNEGITVVDSVPDWISARGMGCGGPVNGFFDWGPMWPRV